jgi:hypothetical protein
MPGPGQAGLTPSPGAGSTPTRGAGTPAASPTAERSPLAGTASPGAAQTAPAGGTREATVPGTPLPGTPLPGTPGAAGTLGPPPPATPDGNLTLASHQGTLRGDEYIVSGALRNDTTSAMRTIRISGTVYDASGNALETQEATYTSEVRPGGLAPFQLTFRRDPRIVRYYLTFSSS